MRKPKSSRRDGVRKRPGYEQLQAHRALLLQRLAHLPPVLQGRPGYRSAKALLTIKYVRSKPTGRGAILRAAQFMIGVLELLPPY
jgi:hypothetical protein